MVRSLPLLLYLALAFFFGIALGERGELGPVQYIFTAVIPLASLILAWRSPGARFSVVLTGALMLGGLVIGQRAFEKAYDECQREGHRVHDAIVAFRAQHGDFPPRLEELPVELPCECIVRDTILHYMANERAFRLWISDDRTRVDFTASGRS